MCSSHSFSKKVTGAEDGAELSMTVYTVIAGYGCGTPCFRCSEAIERHQVEYRVTDPRNGRSLSFHIHCHATWQLESLEPALGAPAAAEQV